MAYLNITEDLSTKGRRKLKVGQILMFEGMVYLKIMRKNKQGVWAKRLDPEKFLTPKEADEKVMVVPKK